MPMGEEIIKLQIPQMVSNNTDNHETAFTVSIDHVDTTTGISTAERSIRNNEMWMRMQPGGLPQTRTYVSIIGKTKRSLRKKRPHRGNGGLNEVSRIKGVRTLLRDHA